MVIFAHFGSSHVGGYTMALLRGGLEEARKVKRMSFARENNEFRACELYELC